MIGCCGAHFFGDTVELFLSMKNQTVAILVAVALGGGVMWYTQQEGFPITTENTVVPSLAPMMDSSQGGSTGSSVPAKPSPVPTYTTKTYHNPAYRFSFEYPSSMTIETAVSPGGFSAQGAIGVIAAFIRISTVVERFSVSVSKEPSDVGTCTKGVGRTWTTTVDGVPFVTYQVTESKEGQNITSTVYRVMHGTFCYELRDTVVSSVTAELTAHQNAQQNANIEAAGALVDSLVQSFRFTN